MRRALVVSFVLSLVACSSADPELWNLPDGLSWEQPELGRGKLQVAFHEPEADLELEEWQTELEVRGVASVFGGVRYLDLILALDTSRSLQSTDPDDNRTAGAVRLVRGMPTRSDIRVGVVDFDSRANLVLPLTEDREAAVRALESLDRDGQTNIAGGIRSALAELERGARPDSTRVILLFTDGRSNAEKAHAAMLEARERGVAIHTILLGESEQGETILRGVASGTGGSFVGVADPDQLADAFVNLRTTGVDRVTLRVNGSLPQPTRLVGGSFSAAVPLRPGENRIVATATDLRGATREAAVSVRVSGAARMRISSPSSGAVLGRRDAEVVVRGEVEPAVGLPAAFELERDQLGVQSVMLQVEGSPPQPATLAEGRFEGSLRLGEGEHRIVATATTADGRTAADSILVTVRPDGCAELSVAALADGKPALSISERAVEIVFDASGSMWGRMEGTYKISVAKQILEEAIRALPNDLELGLRVYGHRQPRELYDCTDTELLVPLASDNGAAVLEAIGGFRPRGQTPLGYSLSQVVKDFGDFAGERAVVLVTDGIESCGGDPVASARELAKLGTVVHVIGFGLPNAEDEDAAALEEIATASGGRFVTASGADELREALAVTVGTAYHILRDGEAVVSGALGSAEPMRLPEGRYHVRLDSRPAREVEVSLVAEEGLAVSFERDGGVRSERSPVEYLSCEEAQPTPAPARPAPDL